MPPDTAISPLQRLQGIQRGKSIDGWNIRIYGWSRDAGVLAAVALVILAAAAGLAWLYQSKEPLEPTKKHLHRVPLSQELAKPNPDLRAVLRGLEIEMVMGGGRLETDLALRKSALSNGDKVVALAYLDTLASNAGEPGADLLYAAHWVKPLPVANELVGDIWWMRNDAAKARKYYERELNAHDALPVREKLVSLLIEQKDSKALAELASDPRFKDLVPKGAVVSLAAKQRHWSDISQLLVKMELGSWKPVPAMLAIVAGAIWMLIALQAIQPHRWISFRTTVPWLAVILGMASTYPTLFAVLWEEEAFGLRHTGDIIGDFIFFMAGVGPREEIIKLVFFLPLLPLVLKRDSRLETLMIGACVGLGFAIQENLQYFQANGPANAFGRFLTANFFHMAATGVLCLALCDALRNPREKGLIFLGTLIAVMISHGAYDAFVAIPDLHSLRFVSIISFVVLSRFFFEQLRRLRDGVTDQLSIAATLAIGLAVLVGVIFVCASAQMGFQPAALSLAYASVALLVIFVMFYRQLGHGMSAAALEQPNAAYRL